MKTKYLFLILLLSLLASVFALSKRSPNIVYWTYSLAAERFVTQDSEGSFETLYPSKTNVKADVYKYPPLFAWGFGFFSDETRLSRVIWALLNFSFFWAGLLSLYVLHFGTPTTLSKGWALFFVVAASMDLNGSILYEQVNAFLCGLLMLGVYFYLKKKHFWAASLLALSVWIKIFPLAIVGPLLLKGPTKFRVYFALCVLGYFLLPGFFRGLEQNFYDHAEWFRVISRDVSRLNMLDMRSLLVKLFVPFWLAQATWVGAILLAVLLTIKNLKVLPNPSWLGFAFCAMLALNSSTESPSFVFIAPAYMGLIYLWPKAQVWEKLLYVLSFVFITLIFTDPFLKIPLPSLPGARYTYKSIGLMLLFAMYIRQQVLICREGSRGVLKSVDAPHL